MIKIIASYIVDTFLVTSKLVLSYRFWFFVT